MTLTFPDSVAVNGMAPEELKIELAIALYNRGRCGKIAAADLAGINLFEFQKALGLRGISSYSEHDLSEEIAHLERIFPPAAPAQN